MYSKPVLCNFFSFKQDVVFTKHYKDSPAVLVSANHSTNRGNLNPLYNSISAWIEVSIPIHTFYKNRK